MFHVEHRRCFGLEEHPPGLAQSHVKLLKLHPVQKRLC